MSERGLGYKPDHEDVRDKLFSASALSSSNLPVTYSLRPYAPHVLDQGSMGACVGFSLAEALYTKQRIVSGSGVIPSPGFIWWNSRKTHGDEKLNEGTYIREAIKTLKTLGICPDASWPMSTLHWHFADQPSALAYRDGYDARFDVEYMRLDSLDDEGQLKSCIVGGHPVVFGITVPKRFLSLGSHRGFKYTSSDVAAGGHAMCVLGYDQDGVFGPNSWGEEWGNQGWFHLSWDWFLGSARDKWAITNLPKIEA